MDIYKPHHVPKRLKTPDHLVDEAWHLANNLTIGRWNRRNIQRTEMTRSVIEVIGRETELRDQDIEAVFTDITISFSAVKFHSNPKLRDGDFPLYTLASTTSQNIAKSEIPQNVLDEILTDALEEGHPLYDEPDELSMTPAEKLEGSTLERSQQVVYAIDYEGDFHDYTLGYSYSINSESVHQIDYTHSETRKHLDAIDGTKDEVRSTEPVTLNGEAIEKDVNNIDSAFEQFIIDREFDNLIEFGGLPKEEHIRRALGMMSMFSSGIIDLRKRPRA